MFERNPLEEEEQDLNELDFDCIENQEYSSNMRTDGLFDSQEDHYSPFISLVLAKGSQIGLFLGNMQTFTELDHDNYFLPIQ